MDKLIIKLKVLLVLTRLDITIQLYSNYMTSFILTLVSFLTVSFGQPVWSWQLSLLSAFVGYALFFKVLLDIKKPWQRFCYGGLFGTAVLLVQLSWLLSHPFWYILAVHFFLSSVFGFQFGLLSLLITKKNIEKFSHILGLAAFWTIMEWLRLFFLAGFAFNQAGHALTANLYSLQTASIWGVYGLTFWVLLVNLFALHVFQKGFSTIRTASYLIMAAFPFLYGALQLHFLKPKEQNHFNILLVQTAFPAEEAFQFKSQNEMVTFVIGEWKQIFDRVKKHQQSRPDLIVLPEGAVPFGTYSFMYRFDEIRNILTELYGKGIESSFPPLELPLGIYYQSNWFVNNAFLSQTLANLFHSGVVIGLEDAQDINGTQEFYSAAQYFQPGQNKVQRYEKRVLVPMGEYIPFSPFKSLCASYGVSGSLTCGKGAKVMECNRTHFGLSICYEEIFGNMMKENRVKGAEILINLTSDVWYPNSRLPQSHFDHAKVRTVEMGIPLARACNTGVTGVIDCFGKNVSILGDGDPNQEWLSDALFVKVPMHNYKTLYSKVGDSLIIGVSLVLLLFFFKNRKT